jgi:phosphoribosylformylglycinamidine synthase
MAFSGNCGLDISMTSEADPIPLLFNEEAGLVMEYLPEDEKDIVTMLTGAGVPHAVIGRTVKGNAVRFSVNGLTELEADMRELRRIWEDTSYRLERLQANPACADEESRNILDRPGPGFSVTFTPKETPELRERPKVAIIREEGSNGDREMTSAFHQAGFECWDVTVSDLMEGRIGLDWFRGVAFVGGFSYADVLDSAKGWAGTIRFHSKLREEFRGFYSRPDTFSLGVCNGCQLMAFLGWVPWPGLEDTLQPRFIHNSSGRFESRFSTVKILPSPSIMLRGMEGSVLGIWVAHGEGRAYFPDKDIYNEVLERRLAPVRYADDLGGITDAYPFNPNGSPAGITSLCSTDGRHLAMMPHPERAFLKWQWAWMPEDWRHTLEVSPWLRMFQNAREWCERT